MRKKGTYAEHLTLVYMFVLCLWVYQSVPDTQLSICPNLSHLITQGYTEKTDTRTDVHTGAHAPHAGTHKHNFTLFAPSPHTMSHVCFRWPSGTSQYFDGDSGATAGAAVGDSEMFAYVSFTISIDG
jgi:hypothetical protein